MTNAATPVTYTATFSVTINSVPAGGGALSPGQYTIALTNTDPLGFFTSGPTNTGGNYNLLWPAAKKTKRPYDTVILQFTMATAGYGFVAPGFVDTAANGSSGLTFGAITVSASQVNATADVAKKGKGTYTYTLNFQSGATPPVQFSIDPTGEVDVSDVTLQPGSNPSQRAAN
ncbi:MAG: hypothetical protein RLZZ15_998 [Verrucomicrobiota bacterium]|jgi:hypothetical protein